MQFLTVFEDSILAKLITNSIEIIFSIFYKNRIPGISTSKIKISTRSNRGKNSNGIILETTIKGNYWAIATQENKEYKYCLLPNSNISFNVYKLKTIENLFQLKGNYNSPNSDFILQDPAVLSLLPDNKKWKLIQPGVLLFGNNLKSISPQAKQIVTIDNNKQAKINEQTLSNLNAFQNTIEQLTNKVTQMEIQSEIFQKSYQREKQEWLSDKEALTKQLVEIEHLKSQFFDFKTKIFSTGNKTIDSNTDTEVNLSDSYQSFYHLIEHGKLEITKVTIPQETIKQARSGTQSELKFVEDKKGNYWIIHWQGVYCLIPKEKNIINQYQYGNFQKVFNCQNYHKNYSKLEII